MEKMKAKRLERDYKALKLTRKNIAMDVIRSFKMSNHPERQCFPEPPDYCQFPQIQEIVDLPANVQVSASTFADVLHLLPDLCGEWRKQIIGQVMEVVKAKERVNQSMDPFFDVCYNSDCDELMGPPPKKTEIPKMSDEEAAAKIRLAATVFDCRRCDPREDDIASFSWGFGPELDYQYNRHPSRLLFYPQIMGHFPCLTRAPSYQFDTWGLYPSQTETRDPTTFLGYGSSKERRAWHSFLQHNAYVSKMAEALVEVAGLDPASATSEDMDKLDIRFVCGICLRRKKQVQAQTKSRENSSDDGRGSDNATSSDNGKANDIGEGSDTCEYGDHYSEKNGSDEGDNLDGFSSVDEGRGDDGSGCSRESNQSGRPIEVGLFEWRAMVSLNVCSGLRRHTHPNYIG